MALTVEASVQQMHHHGQMPLSFPPPLPCSLIPMHQDQWMEDGVREVLMPGDEVTVMVHKIRQPGLYRWPVQLKMLAPAFIAANHVMDPDEYEAPISHAWATEQGWGMEEILEATGRVYDPIHYLIPQDHSEVADELQQVTERPLVWFAGWIFTPTHSSASAGHGL